MVSSPLLSMKTQVHKQIGKLVGGFESSQSTNLKIKIQTQEKNNLREEKFVIAFAVFTFYLSYIGYFEQAYHINKV